MPFIFAFDHKHPKAPMELKDLLGGKGANLAEMTSQLKLPVPPGFTISTEACRYYLKHGWPEPLTKELDKAIAKLEKTMGKKLGQPDNPLLVSVRSGAKFSMPGMMDTVLNLGLNDKSVTGLKNQTNDERFAYDSYRRFISMFGRIVLGIASEKFDKPLEQIKEQLSISSDSLIPVSELKKLVELYKEIVKQETKKSFPQDPYKQLRLAIEAVFRSWNTERARAYREKENISHDLGTAVNVQAMVFGNRDDNSGTGVAFTRNPSTGEAKPYGDFLTNAQGEDVVAGIRNTEPLSALQKKFPNAYKELLEIFKRLEAHYKDMCDTEFTIEQGKLWMLQTRVGKRTGRAALKMAVDMTKDPHIRLTKQEAVLRISPEHIEQVLHPQFATKNYKVLTKGLAASPGAAVGKVYLSADKAAQANKDGKKVILVRPETSPDDIHGMLAAEGILTARGGLVSHAAVVARGWGKPAVVGAQDIKVFDNYFQVGNYIVKEGDYISIDGTSGEVVHAQLPLATDSHPKELDIILGWADQIRGNKISIRANADTAQDAQVARNLGAKGIGLCRTEHMFLAPDRLPLVQKVILAQTLEEESAALNELAAAQKQDFEGILKEMDGLPVTVRLLDPPLHEFLPKTEELEIKKATTGLTEEENKLYRAALFWKEFNPMLGVRGVRLGILKPGLYSMQVKALMQAALERLKKGEKPIIEIMIPLTISKAELALARSWVTQAIEQSKSTKLGSLKVSIGTMIETPRAAILADEIAQAADFFSFGTNDLTQMTFGFSRDDIEGKMMSKYLELELLERNPFETVDKKGVGYLIRLAVEKGKKTNPRLKLGICGEHGGDAQSIRFFYNVGLDYVSCSPYRVPVARISAAQAVIESNKELTKGSSQKKIRK
jgi:pyruvate,orthophosphate dikinase